MDDIVIGVLALQGAFAKHEEILSFCGVKTKMIRKPRQLSRVQGLVMPGGESTTLTKLMNEYGFYEPLQEFGSRYPIMGTCAGCILMGNNTGDPRAESLKLMEIDTQRNAYGRQVDSFRDDIEVKGLTEPFPAIFIRAPKIIKTGKRVEILAEYNGSPILVRQGRHMALTFHPELTGDLRIHEMFIHQVRSAL